ncbi:Proline porter II [Serratia quinivorans]|uniref:MFS transporter n=1 Tax=Serratia quinivorans TaxID=137545 RepID=UPI0021786D5B|nr:MFS transporter [Serratia quinivorans]CAI1720747.1 Proline porter II [Serratia quinivorans]
MSNSETLALASNKESKIKSVCRVISGNFLEMYDFMIYGYYASAIAKTFFPAESAFASLMLSLAVFGSGFLVRPLGGIVLGAYVDRHGRRKGLVLTLALMALGTLLIALVPGYATIGAAAPLLVLTGRLLQGFSAGVELGGVSVYLSEIAPPGRKGFYCAWQSASTQVAVVVAALVGLWMNYIFPIEDILDWAWRIPFFLGCIIVPFLFHVRRSLQETDVFLANRIHPTFRQVLRTIGIHWRLIVASIGMSVMTTVSFYTITAYTPTFGKEVLGLSAGTALLVTACVGLNNFIWQPISGALSDRFGRHRVLFGATALTLFTAYPFMHWLVSEPSFGRLLMVELWLSFLYALYNGTLIITLIEQMPAQVRTSGFSFAYGLALVLGGFTPAISTYFIHLTGNKSIPGLWMTLAACCAMAATWWQCVISRNRAET